MVIVLYEHARTVFALVSMLVSVKHQPIDTVGSIWRCEYFRSTLPLRSLDVEVLRRKLGYKVAYRA